MSATKHTPEPWIHDGRDIYGPPDARSKHRNGRALIGGVVDEHVDWRGWPTTTDEERRQLHDEAGANITRIVAAVNACAGDVFLNLAARFHDAAAAAHAHSCDGPEAAWVECAMQACASDRAALRAALERLRLIHADDEIRRAGLPLELPR